MGAAPDPDAASPCKDRRLLVYNGGFLTQTRVRRILALSGYSVRLGKPGPGDAVAVWGKSPTSGRGEAVAAAAGVPVIRVEDAFLRSVLPGRSGAPPIGLLMDASGVHFDPDQPSDLETLLATHPLDDTALLDRGRHALAALQEADLSKYNAHDGSLAPPPPGYVLVIDQTRGDASVTACGADRNRFLEMLFVAQDEHPGAQIVIKTHPETQAGQRPGYFETGDLGDRITLVDDAISPWTLFEGAVAVYTVSSHMGFEAIFAGHRPRVFGQPFYTGWGLTEDEFPVQRRQRRLSRAQLFAAAMILYPTWYDPCRDQLCDLETAITMLAAEARAWREDHRGWVASGMRQWKRQALQRMFGRVRTVRFADTPAAARAAQRPWMVWAGKAEVGHADAIRVEDGFLRSRGLGAELVPPLSLTLDDLGVYYDPSRPSRLETRIADRAQLRPDQAARARQLVTTLCDAGLSKYNLTGEMPYLPPGHRILVPGQVEDDASIQLGAGDIRTNRALLQAVRDANPTAVVIYKPHPDVEAGLRPGGVCAADLADVVAANADPAALLTEVDAVWTMTSLLGFEALLRQVEVVTFGAPFYAGWGLTRDLGDIPPRRRARPSLEGLVYATLIDHPRYLDPKTGLPCPVEILVERLIANEVPQPGPFHRGLSKLQGVFASRAHLWR